MTHTFESLCAFSERVKQAFLDKRIKAPVHLCDPNQAEQLIEIFEDIPKTDWVCSNWRSMFHALLHGIDEEWLFNEILSGRSMYIFNKEHRFLSSSIVAGMLPIASGIALGAKRRGLAEMVHVFVGDMTERTGLFHEFRDYCSGHDLPIHIIYEDNGLSTNTPTQDVWGTESFSGYVREETRYEYNRTVPHVGVGSYVSF